MRVSPYDIVQYPQTEEQAKNILTKDWLDYKRARRKERVGKALAITGGTFLIIGIGSTTCIPHYARNYNEEYDKYNKRKRNYPGQEHKDLTQCLLATSGAFAIGTPLLIIGIKKAKQEHSNATQIINRHIEEYERTQGKTSMSKPEFNIDSRGNNIVFSLTF